ncbi:ABC transporter permease [Methanosphaerula palustris]|uniref:Binding-protein-dependent transport systems inner membrane component n=1 Tax=Methanosphaerula palustris (strain ATCC BAA-1556 / DSM 19958 / E1-9c) TaxID=521011 RepID=B8GG22_METPE|nr:ABC transporter permease [Methanosphaerula palustris]ACL16096.1 binding-protein-dependent transport systems inner membrane component [Methanosphaerula palustris E1-9c]
MYCAVALFAPVIAPFDPLASSDLPLVHPDATHLLGTNDLAQDIFSMLIWGTRATLILGFLGAVVSTALGTTVGIVTGYYRGWTDEVIMRILDVIMTIPSFPLLLLLTFFFSPGIYLTAVIMGLLGSFNCVRIIRAQTLSLAAADFIIGTKALGARDGYIMVRHILPNILPLVGMKFVTSAQHFMLVGIGLGFLGMADPNVVDWGQMIERASTNGGITLGLWWWLIPPGLAVTGISLALAWFAYALEDEMNPHLQVMRI